MRAKPTGRSRSLEVDDPDARSFYHDSGYGRPTEDGLRLSAVEARNLESRGKIQVEPGAPDPDPAVYAVYSDLRERGYYLQHQDDDAYVDRFPRGEHPANSEATRVDVSTERGTVDLTEIEVLAVYDRENDVTYFELDDWEPAGETAEPQDRYVAEHRKGGYVVDEPGELHTTCFYGTPLEDGAVQLDDEEARYLHDEGLLDVEEPPETSRETEVYADLRDAGTCPRTGFKFGTAFRVYETVTDADDLPHSDYLVEPGQPEMDARALSRAVRLAHGVRKTMVFALPDGDYVSAERHTP